MAEKLICGLSVKRLVNGQIQIDGQRPMTIVEGLKFFKRKGFYVERRELETAPITYE